jgi:hypothetical protein
MKTRTQLLGALLLAALLCGYARAQSSCVLKNDESPQTSSIKESFVTVENLRVRYIESGNGPTVVMIHGNAGSLEDFEFGAIDALSSNYRVSRRVNRCRDLLTDVRNAKIRCGCLPGEA